MSFSLKRDGDAIERKWVNEVTKNFSNYEPFWMKHVVPITWRMANRNIKYVRSAVSVPLKNLATYNYGVFLHLAGCHQQLEAAEGCDEANAQLYARSGGVYTFYSHLYSAGCLISDFFDSVAGVVDKYHGNRKGTRPARFECHSSDDLNRRYDALKSRASAYRNPQVHHWGYPAIGRLIPRPDHLEEWSRKDLGELDRFLNRDGLEERIRSEFVDAIKQSADDLAFAEAVINDIWSVALDELATITDKDRYSRDQAKGRDGTLPQRPIGGSPFMASGAV